jgi:uncharacterized membrane protein YcaP (DUF421 family)
MFDLSAAPWEFVLRGAMVYFALMILVRVSGKRTIGEFTPFDMVVVLLLAESTQGALTGGDESVFGALIVCATLVALNYAVGFASARSQVIDRLVEGEPVVLMRNGKELSGVLRKHNVPPSDLEEALRHAGIAERSQVAFAVLETDGEISVVKRRRPRTR